MSEYIKFNRSTSKDEAMVSPDSNIVYFTNDTHQIIMRGHTYSDIPLYQQYKLYGGTVSEQAFSVIMKYHLTPFMISNTGVTTIPDDLLNNTQTNFVTEYYWNLMRLTGGEPIVTTQWDDNIPIKLKGISSNKEFAIDFANKTITLIS